MDIVKNKKLGLSCPECNKGDQIYRQNRETGEFFIGCTGFPNCRWTSELSDDKLVNKQFDRTIRKELRGMEWNYWAD